MRVVLALVSLFIAAFNTPVLAGSEARGQTPQSSVPLTLFYHPPRDSTSLSVVAERFHSAIFTRGDERYRDQLREAGFSGPIMQYLVANEASGAPELRNANDPCGDYLTSGNDVSGIARDFCQALHPYEDDPTTAPVKLAVFHALLARTKWHKDPLLLPLNPVFARWIEYFVSHATANARQMGYTGLFIDNLDRSLERGLSRSENSDGHVAEYRSDQSVS